MDDSVPPIVERLPIKLILPRQGKERRVEAGGGRPVPFRTVDAAFRRSLVSEVSSIDEVLRPSMKETGAIHIRVQLHATALAKSHRPNQLFSSDTCPIVGAGRLGELFVKATPKGLENLRTKIKDAQSDQLMKEISCVTTIQAVTPTFRRKGIESADILRRSPRRGEKGFLTRVRLFNFGTDEHQPRLVQNFQETCRQRNISINSSGYSSSSYIYGAECHSVDDVEVLSQIVGVRSVTGMPLIRSILPQMFNPKPLKKLATRDEFSGDIPVVVVVDSGISSQNTELKTWVVGRSSHVAPQYHNTDHGTFVAGLICWGNELNPTIAGIDSSPCGVFDLQVIPN